MACAGCEYALKSKLKVLLSTGAGTGGFAFWACAAWSGCEPSSGGACMADWA